MIKSLNNYIQRYFGDPEILALFFLVAGIALIFFIFREIMMPILASIVIAYLLQWLVQRLENWRVPHILAVAIVFTLFLTLVVISLLGLLPLLGKQLSNMVKELPNTLGKGQETLVNLPARYPSFISVEQMSQILDEIKVQGGKLGQVVLSTSLATIPSVFAVIIYLVLVPMLVYFFLMDQKIILAWFASYLPRRRKLISKVWNEVHKQLGNYVGGKFIEIIIVWFACYLVFAFMGLQYAMLLSALVGLSALVPYIGAVVVTVPVVIIALVQWGWSASFFYLILAYSIIVALDANVLVPFLFSEMVSLHPVAIIIATLVFGSLWGFWGVFFAIPLAILVKSILNNVVNQSQKT